MNNYELVCIFNVKENHFEEGVASVRNLLTTQGASITKEDDMGAKSLAYPIKKEDRGHYFLYEFQREGELTKLEDLLKLQKGLIRHLFIRIEKPRKQRTRPVRRSSSTGISTMGNTAPVASEPAAVTEGE